MQQRAQAPGSPCEQDAAIPVLHVRRPTLAEAWEHAVVDTCKLSFFGFSVIDLHFINRFGGQIFRRHFGILAKKFLTVNQHILHILTHGFDITGLIYFNTRDFFQQILDNRIGFRLE